MVEALYNSLVSWNQTTTDKQKLQHTYVVLLLTMTFIAGVIALFSGELSRYVMYTVLAIITTFIVNFVVWSILKSTVLDKLPKARATRPTTTPKTRRR